MHTTNTLFEKYQTIAEPWFQKGVPWFTGDSIAWLEQNITRDDRVLEYGGGRSTFWWAQSCNRVTTIETSPEWASYLMLWMYNFPALLKKVRILFCPAEWNPGWKQGRKQYWKENQDALSYRDVAAIQNDFLRLNAFGDETVLAIDGGVRGPLLVHLGENNRYHAYEIIVIDNTEAAFHSIAPDLYIDSQKYQRLDFIAGTMDTVPQVNQGKHVTTVFVRKDRFEKCVDVTTEHKYRYTAKELSQHQLFEYSMREVARAKGKIKDFKNMFQPARPSDT